LELAKKEKSGERIWTIHGKRYDLTPFILKHPGGTQILERALLMEDCGVMFETYHAFSNKEAIRNQLEKYRIDDMDDSKKINNSVPVYNFEEYEELTNRIKKFFPDRKSIKAPLRFYIKNACFISLHFILFIAAMLSDLNYLVKGLLGILSGIMWVCLGFNIIHDGSHYAISIRPKVNELMESILNGFGLLNSLIWHLEHVYGHHSFTGNIRYDPDFNYYRPFVRKFREDTKGVKKLFTSFQDKLIIFIALFFPGMYVGQSLSYLDGALRNSIWGVKLPRDFLSYLRWYEYVTMIFSLYCIWKGLFFPAICYFTTINILYHLNVAGDHDTYENSVEYMDRLTNNWVKMQICHSGNFKNDSSIWTHMFGGINYQIEHHLFPNMSHMHYEKIKPIVQEFCKEKGYPYVHHPSLWQMYMSFLKNIKYQGQEKDSKND
jgi:linoleoyl-CoA desaturase